MLQPLKPRPSAWAIHCVECGNMCGRSTRRANDNYGWWTCPCTPGDSVMHRHDRPMMALWQHEWAAVAWMAWREHALAHIHEQVGATRLTLTCDESTCAAQRTVTEVHCTTMNIGYPE